MHLIQVYIQMADYDVAFLEDSKKNIQGNEGESGRALSLTHLA